MAIFKRKVIGKIPVCPCGENDGSTSSSALEHTYKSASGLLSCSKPDGGRHKLIRRVIGKLPKSSSTEKIQSDWNQTDITSPDYIKNKPNIEDIIRRLTEVERKVDYYHPDVPVKPAYAIVTTKPTQSTISDIVGTAGTKPVEQITMDMTFLNKPTMCYFVYPQSWEVLENDVIQLPYVVDSNGFKIGVTIDLDTPIIVLNEVNFRVLDIRLGKDIYKLSF